MSNTIKARISLKIDTAEKWKQSELILLSGELGIESDTRKIKIGDGKSRYSDLQYANFDQSELDNYILKSEKGTNNGVATLDGSGKVPASQLPSYVDDVIESENKGALPPTGEEGKIYVTKDDNKTYRWGGSSYVEISASLALGETTGTAYEGNKGKANADAIEALKGRVEAVEGTTQGLGALAKKDTVGTADIDNNSVTNEKIVSVDVSKLTQGSEELIISCGDSTVA